MVCTVQYSKLTIHDIICPFAKNELHMHSKKILTIISMLIDKIVINIEILLY